jgi:hypothetical protein
VCRDFTGEARFATAAGTGKGEQTSGGKEPSQLTQLSVSANETREVNR